MDIKKLRKKIVWTSYNSKKGHIPSALSILDILWVLYNKVLKINPQNSNDPDRDRFILSKGHGALGLYAVLADKGLIDWNELEGFCKFDSILGGHPHRGKIPWVEASTGSLGHGVPISIGIAMGLKIQKKPAKVYVLLGDGECNEGTIWESAMLASHHKLSNLVFIIDFNHSTDRALEIGSLEDKFKAFGWDTETVDGHDIPSLTKTFHNLTEIKNKPKVIIANTIKGFGIKSMENEPAWHHRSPNEEEFKNILEVLYANN